MPLKSKIKRRAYAREYYHKNLRYDVRINKARQNALKLLKIKGEKRIKEQLKKIRSIRGLRQKQLRIAAKITKAKEQLKDTSYWGIQLSIVNKKIYQKKLRQETARKEYRKLQIATEQRNIIDKEKHRQEMQKRHQKRLREYLKKNPNAPVFGEEKRKSSHWIDLPFWEWTRESLEKFIEQHRFLNDYLADVAESYLNEKYD